jgi:hypothetical protein
MESGVVIDRIEPATWQALQAGVDLPEDNIIERNWNACGWVGRVDRKRLLRWLKAHFVARAIERSLSVDAAGAVRGVATTIAFLALVDIDALTWRT